VTTPKVAMPKTHKLLHGILYTIAAVALFFCVIHAIVAVALDWPPHLVNLHLGFVIVLGLLAWRAEINHRREENLAARMMVSEIQEWLDGDAK